MATTNKSSKARKPLTRQELQYCEHYCIHGNQTQAYRETWPDIARPADHATKLMKRADVRKHIALVLDKMQAKAAERSAEALTLTLEKAESRLAEMVDVRRLNRGEMFTQMTGDVLVKGVTYAETSDDKGKVTLVRRTSKEFEGTLEQPKPIDDADLVKAIDATFKRLGAYPGKKDAAHVPNVNHYLYQPKWLVQQAAPRPQLAAGDE